MHELLRGEIAHFILIVFENIPHIDQHELSYLTKMNDTKSRRKLYFRWTLLIKESQLQQIQHYFVSWANRSHVSL